MFFYFAVRILLLACAVWLADHFTPGVKIAGGYQNLLLFALALGLMNAVLKPILELLALPITLLTFGTFSLLLNIALVYAALNIFNFTNLSGMCIAQTHLCGIWVSVVVFSLIVSTVNYILSEMIF
jgi:putative membrane protein